MQLLIAGMTASGAAAAGLAVYTAQLRRQLATERTCPTTGAATRRAFRRLARRHLHHPNAVVMLLDLDGFKPVNDTYGHAAGDRVLTVTAARIARYLGPRAVLGRLGGDEFAAVVALSPTTWRDTLHGLADEIAQPITVQASHGTASVRVTASIGAVHLADVRHRTVTQALHLADALMYRAKHGPSGRYVMCEAPAELPAVAADRPTQRQRHHGPATRFGPASMNGRPRLARWLTTRPGAQAR